MSRKAQFIRTKRKNENDVGSGQTSDRIRIMRARMAVKRKDKRGEEKGARWEQERVESKEGRRGDREKGMTFSKERGISKRFKRNDKKRIDIRDWIE
jgi:hypothetical protein